jgi:sulfite exporter TauE/SafE
MVLSRFERLNFFNVFPEAEAGMGYGMLFMIGLLTSVHCVAMCGGIHLSQCVRPGLTGGRFSVLRPSLLYNAGRVTAYTIVGGLVGALGSVVSFSGAAKGLVQLAAGVFMVIMGLNMLGIFPWLRRVAPRMPEKLAGKIQGTNKSPLYVGLLNGLMPCGPLQAMQLYALATGSLFAGALSMLSFGLGTVPLMFGLGTLSSFLNKKFTGKMMTASAVLVVIFGVSIFSSGMSLAGLSLGPSVSKLPSGKVAVIEDDVQTVTIALAPGRYEPMVVQKGIPVKLIIQAGPRTINGCNNRIIIPKYKLEQKLKPGENIIKFTPLESGTVIYSCWMGMIRSSITVVDDLSRLEPAPASDSQAAD